MSTENTASSTDPFIASLDQISALIKELLTRYSSLASYQELKPEDDPIVQDYLSQYLGGARSLLNSYPAASSGSRAAGALSGSEAYHQAIKTLASEYSKKYDDALKNAATVREAQRSEQSSTLGSLNDLLMTRNKLLSAQGDYLNDAAARAYDLEMARAQAALQAQKAAEDEAKANSDRENAQLARDQALADESRWRNLQAKARLVSRIGKAAAGWTNADDLQSDRLGVQFGYYQPWSRKLEIRMGGSKR